MEKEKRRKRSFQNSGVGGILARSLTRDQIAHLLEVVFAAGDAARYLDEFRKTDPDMAQTVERILKIDSGQTQGPPLPRIASDERILECWSSLWSRWDDAVLDVGDEKGKYAIQDVHWEPPYFDGYALAEDLEEIAADMVDLNDDESITFFAELPDAVCRQIYECFESKGQGRGQDNVYSKWHKINHHYEQRFDSSGYLETCRKHLAENWQYGKALIDDAVAQADYQKADSLLYQTFSSYLRNKEKAWYPDTSLLLDEQSYYHSDGEEEIAGLLELWGSVSEYLGNTSRSAASKLQSVMCRTPEKWDAVICEYKKLLRPEVKDVLDHLFLEWQTEMARRSVHDEMDNKIFSSTWIHWLIEAELEPSSRKKWFLKKLNLWLEHLKKDGKTFERQWPLLARLTKDLPGSNNLRKRYPTFFKVILPADSSPSLLAKTRCGGLKKMNTSAYLLQSMDIWKSNLGRLMPNPANSHKSNYKEHAEWMKALYELSHDEYKYVLAEWHKAHKQRRNLWRDMKSHQLPI